MRVEAPKGRSSASLRQRTEAGNRLVSQALQEHPLLFACTNSAAHVQSRAEEPFSESSPPPPFLPRQWQLASSPDAHSPVSERAAAAKVALPLFRPPHAQLVLAEGRGRPAARFGAWSSGGRARRRPRRRCPELLLSVRKRAAVPVAAAGGAGKVGAELGLLHEIHLLPRAELATAAGGRGGRLRLQLRELVYDMHGRVSSSLGAHGVAVVGLAAIPRRPFSSSAPVVLPVGLQHANEYGGGSLGVRVHDMAACMERVRWGAALSGGRTHLRRRGVQVSLSVGEAAVLLRQGASTLLPPECMRRPNGMSPMHAPCVTRGAPSIAAAAHFMQMRVFQ
jgi:hypothetical protein